VSLSRNQVQLHLIRIQAMLSDQAMTTNNEGFVNDQTRENWRKVAEALALAGKTNSVFYKRAMIVVKTGKDPYAN
jgi:hypothetical protein